MLSALLVFLIGCLVLAVVIYVVHLLMGMIELPPQVKQIALLILGLIFLIVILMLALSVYSGGQGVVIRL